MIARSRTRLSSRRHTLKSVFHHNVEQEKEKALLGKYLERNLMDAICEFLRQLRATKMTRDQWHRLNIDPLDY
jgi:hypothetical protein